MDTWRIESIGGAGGASDAGAAGIAGASVRPGEGRVRAVCVVMVTMLPSAGRPGAGA
ncbi:hypothetical protein GCM10022241_22630 [Micrococcus endophyticus]